MQDQNSKTRSRAFKNPNRGFSLIEVLVSLALGAVLLTGTIQLMVNGKANATTNATLSEMQEQARLVFMLMSNAVQSAGYVGCLSLYADDLADGVAEDGSINDPFFRADRVITGTEGGDASDTLTVRYASRCGGGLQAGQSTRGQGGVASDGGSRAFDIFNAAACDFTDNVGRQAVISDCTGVEVFTLRSVTDNRISQDSLQAVYSQDAEVFAIREDAFRVGPATVNDSTPSEDLLQLRLSRASHLDLAAPFTQSIAQNIEKMDISYGVPDAQGTPVFYPADEFGEAAVLSWRDVVAVNVQLQMRSMFKDTSRYAEDGYLRKQFSSTIYLINRDLNFD